MKKTININLGGVPFIVDEDAYSVLSSYLSDVSSRLEGDNDEILPDIESRIAEIFSGNLSLRLQVVDLGIVNRAISVIGRPDEFGEKRKAYTETANGGNDTNEPRRLYRNTDDKILGGVCSGLADYFNIDTVIVRVIMLLLLALGGLSLWVYIILWIVIPKTPYINNGGNCGNE